MKLTGVVRDLDIDGIVAALPTYTEIGRATLKERLSSPCSCTTASIIQDRQNEIRAIRQRCGSGSASFSAIATLRQQLKDTEADLVSVSTAANDSRNVEYYTQILWDPTFKLFAWLNEIDWLHEIVVLLRTLLLPGISILLPLLVMVAPLVIICLSGGSVTISEYVNLLQGSLKKAMPSVLGKPRFAGQGGVLEIGEQAVHIGASVAMFVASIWNQISGSLSLRAVVEDMRRRARAIRTFTTSVCDLGQLLLGVNVLETHTWWLECGELGLFGRAYNDSKRLLHILHKGGELDMLAAIAFTKQTTIAQRSDTTIAFTDLYHPSIPESVRVYNSLKMMHGNGNHVLLTGPNRGGKSTLLKAVGTAILMAQTVGIVFARKAAIPVFTNIITALAPQDIIGQLSLFESEIEFAKEVRGLLKMESGPTFLMMDEIFHGTNAHDGVAASQVFLDDLYSNIDRSVFSIVSTHYMELPERYKDKDKDKRGVQMLCMDATEAEAGTGSGSEIKLKYTYRVREGVNTFSSVREILKERGLLE